jgi:DNA mismatch endonuclease (patch repair protein)
VFPVPKVVLLVDGCFWHGCPEHATYPKSNTAYWLPKLKANKERDRRQTARLREAGWTVVRVWEHDCRPVNQRVVTRVVSICRTLHKSGDENGRR